MKVLMMMVNNCQHAVLKTRHSKFITKKVNGGFMSEVNGYRMPQKIQSTSAGSQFESRHNEKIDGPKVKVNTVDHNLCLVAPITFGFVSLCANVARD